MDQDPRNVGGQQSRASALFGAALLFGFREGVAATIVHFGAGWWAVTGMRLSIWVGVVFQVTHEVTCEIKLYVKKSVRTSQRRDIFRVEPTNELRALALSASLFDAAGLVDRGVELRASAHGRPWGKRNSS